MGKKCRRWAIIAVILLPVLFSLSTGNPEGTAAESPYYDASEVTFLSDLTFQREGETVREQTILSEELAMIEEAREFILLDMFLFNDAYNKEAGLYPDSVEQISNALIEKKRAMPQMPIIFITDPINGFYGAYEEKHIQAMEDSGITVVETDLDQLKDSNFLYSGYYRLFIRPFGTEGKGWITNPFDKSQPKINVRTALRLANFKANHRKLLVTEQAGLITSANPHDASSYHSNVAVKVKSPVVQDMIEGERALARFSGTELPELKFLDSGQAAAESGQSVAESGQAVAGSDGSESENGGTAAGSGRSGPGAGIGQPALSDTKVRYLTEDGIFNGLMKYIDAAGEGDTIEIGIFYISDFDLVKGLKRAAERGASVRIAADPNKDAFGIEKDGSPNRTVLSRLQAGSENIEVRWYDTHGEQYHTKMALFSLSEKNVIILGSGNYTRRNLRGYNLECDLEIVAEGETAFSKETAAYFDRIWNNRDGEFTVDFSQYEEDSPFKLLKYWLQESTGLCTY